MKAIQYKQLGQSDVLKFVDVETPQPKADEVLIQLKAASLNHLDLHFRRGLPVPFPIFQVQMVPALSLKKVP